MAEQVPLSENDRPAADPIRPSRVRDLPRRIRRSGPLALEAAVALAAAALAVRFLPSPRVTRLLGRALRDPEPRPEVGRAAEARRIGWTVERMAGLLPWRPVCLPQAIATRWMLTRRGIVCESHLGITGSKPLEAHAWVTVSDAVVQGGSVTGVTELALFR